MRNALSFARFALMAAVLIASIFVTTHTADAQPPAHAAGAPGIAAGWQITVVLQGVEANRGGVLRCSLYKSARGFPMDPNLALATVIARGTGVQRTCVFRVASGGDYAVSVGHDEDGDREVDTNVFGAPTEGWGTTRNVTHAFSAPTFEESKFNVTAPRWRIALSMHY